MLYTYAQALMVRGVRRITREGLAGAEVYAMFELEEEEGPAEP